MANYSYQVVFASEAISTLMAIYFGESVIANEVLSMTKGHSMGWGFVSLGFGMAFGVGILVMGFISARMNPGVVLAELILGQIDGIEFIAAVCGEFLGAFVGATLVWLHFLPHFGISPAPAPDTINEMLVGQEGITQTAISLASYNTQLQDISARKKGIQSIGNTWDDIKRFMHSPENQMGNQDLVEKVLGHHALVKGDSSHSSSHSFSVSNESRRDFEEGRLRRRSAQVAAIHETLKDVDLDDYKNLLLARTDAAQPSTNDDYVQKVYLASRTADQNAKLSIFATRPAMYSPIHNLLCEFLCSTALIFPSLMILQRSKQMYDEQSLLYNAQIGLTLGFFIFLLVLGLGGPTSLAANPARDFSPRLAHFLLPIKGKGPSEFYYCWIPILGGFCGGCAAAGLYAAVQCMNRSNIAA